MPDPELVFLPDFGSVFEVLGCKLTFFFFKQWQTDTRNLRKIKFQDQLMNPQFGPTETAGIYRLILIL